MFCIKCGFRILDTDRFCCKCGYKVSQVVSVIPIQHRQPRKRVEPVSIYEKKSTIVSVFKQEYFNIAKRRFIVLDIETTGLSKYADGIVEIAALKYVGGMEVDRFVTLVNPEMMIPQAAINVHHITNQMVRNAPKISEVMPGFLSFAGDSLIVGHNANFDIGFLEVSARRLGYDPVWHYIDTISVAKKILPGLQNYKQATVLDAIGYKQNEYHRAEQDCRGCAQILLLAMGKIS